MHDKRKADRVKAVIALGSGWSPSDVAEDILLDEQTIRSYFLKYKESGEYGLIQLNYSGKEPFLNEYEKLKKTKRQNDPIYFTDAALM
jgi:transposase